MMGDVIRIAAQEPARLDTRRIVVLRQSLGPKRCREVVEEVVFHLTERLTRLEMSLMEGDVAEAARLASRLASLSEQVGLADFARVSRDLGMCLDAKDEVAVAAVAARLIRLGEDSLFSAISYAEHSAL
jgi:hypothetical protein